MAKKRNVFVKKKLKSKSGRSKTTSDLLRKNPPKNKSKSKPKSGRRRIRLLLLFLIWISLLILGLIIYITHDLPKVSSLTGPKSSQSLRMLALDGSPLVSFGNQWGSYVSIDEISPLLTQAVIATEDRRFYQHSGILAQMK